MLFSIEISADPNNNVQTWLISDYPLLVSIIRNCAHHKPVKLVMLEENVMVLKFLE
jgi:hypothetical protein